MGEIADMMLDGTLDCVTGEYLGLDTAFPVTTEKRHPNVLPYEGYYGEKIDSNHNKRDTKCPGCQKMMRGEGGLEMHMKDKHGITL